MSDIQKSSSIGYLTYAGDYSVPNTRVLGGVTQLWQDAFSRALTQGVDDNANEPAAPAFALTNDSSTGEPVAGAQALGKIVEQRACPVVEVERKPAVPLFLPIAEFETDLLPPPNEPFSISDMIAQQRHLDIENNWVRPNVINPYDDSVNPGPGPQPKPLHLPIAEFEWDLLPPPAEPFSDGDMVEQQRQLNFDSGWARPLILQNLRMAA